MCGIVGIISNKNVVNKIFSSLERLEYRGYDSAGIAVVQSRESRVESRVKRKTLDSSHSILDSKIDRRRTPGKLAVLKAELKKNPLIGTVGIGHTRWATHGLPVTKNAHPHSTNKVSIVHNGIIENFSDLRNEMEKAGYKFTSQTDTEVIPILITYYLDKGLPPFDAFKKTLKRLEGAFAIGAIFADDPGLLMAARKGSPLAIGYGKGEMYLASDAIALAPLTQKITYLEEDDYARISLQGCEIYNGRDKKVKREIKRSGASSKQIDKGNYPHYMLKEIYEQPTTIAETLNAYYDPVAHKVNLPKAKFDIHKASKINIIACGTSYYAGMIAKYWIEGLCRIPVEVDIASEFRYRQPVFTKGGITMLISQSGETADTLAALKIAKANKQKIISIVNVLQSSIARESELSIPTLAGPEISVASTKGFTAQLTCLAVLAVALAKKDGDYLQELVDVPALVDEALHGPYQKIAVKLAQAQTVLYMGRGASYPIALEGALKLKELSYIHAEGFGAGELKHGPIALVDKKTPVIVLAPDDEYLTKTVSNVREVAARGGKIILIGGRRAFRELQDVVYEFVEMPEMPSFIAPIVYSVPVQLLAYYTAVEKGANVDQPRNLAKSVTVE